MTKTDKLYDGQEISYEVGDDGYDIYLSGRKWITQHEPYIPYPNLSYEESCKKHIEEILSGQEKTEIFIDERDKKIAELSAIMDDLILNVIPAIMEANTEN